MDQAAAQQAGSKADGRRRAIEEAAYRVLVRDGYKAASILAIAKEAKASNETLYRWYGNKQGLFAALVERNAEAARELLSEALAGDLAPLDALEKLGPVLLRIVTSERAVALNRAAAGDVYDTGTLGEALAKGGRESLVPLIAKLLAQADAEGALLIVEPDTAADDYINLLIGDLQIRRAIGAVDMPTEAAIVARSTRALNLMRQLYAAS
ncbi:MAG: TetR/AcrR family transcriptional regulator [Rhizobiales bacterium]|nr:TetR/AcrR family transcriptional regulator [Hyphomicrobiales bacterium]MBO6699838.1 TetR/AcrR family transcriptional regulator [Hyphomicrobiales bacterium]MBO6737376.1 TetR/AcrR family transcriptional regulator [Hyphomicrobiales bacterium]MBO6911550.1 TetR/AcrR family transcriptional regulator [Hyphomicrobiales bacterium]MBO6955150.1 TetR/AcrR family transcriptional regulator [Hyphomicrobiales bacterium]